MKDSYRFYAAVFCICGSVIALQIFQSRLFSVTTWYHLSFLVISIAMFGMTLGALKVYKGDHEQLQKNYILLARKHAGFFAVFIILSLLGQLYMPIISTDFYGTLLTLPFLAALTCVAYYNIGVVVSLCLTRSPYPIGRVYAADLIGAGAGCIFALAIMESVDTPSGLIFLAGLVFFATLLFPANSVSASPNEIRALKAQSLFYKFFGCACILLASLNIVAKKPFLYPLWMKDNFITNDYIYFEAWNSISRITVYHEVSDVKPYLWGSSSLLPENMKATYRFLMIDGSAGTPITKFDGDFTKVRYLDYDITNLAYSLPNINNAAIIGVGGGRDLLSAKYFNVGEVWAIDVNPVQIHLLADHPEIKEYTGLYKLPGVHLINSEARSWFRQNTTRMDLIQMSLIDTWAATGAGAYALSENGLYTVEAWQNFMNDLSDNGVFTVSRWSKDTLNDTGRMLSVAIATLFKLGVTDIRNHIILAQTDRIATLILARSPLTQQQIDSAVKTINEKQFTPVIIPGQPVEDGVIRELLEAANVEELNKISDKQYFDVSPSTDMRPFFFNQARFSKPLEIFKMATAVIDGNNGVSFGQAKATLNLFVIIIFSFFMVIFTIIYPMIKKIKDISSPGLMAGTCYFSLIGLGFMFLEISLLQALGIYLGHPIYGLGVVLFSLIISAGVGSLLSDRMPLRSFKAQIMWCTTCCVFSIALALGINTLFNDFAEAELMLRVAISIMIVAPVGILAGFGFPTGLNIVQTIDKRATAWFWGINGAAGVLGSSLALAFNICFGIDKTLMVGGVCYLLLAVPLYSFYKLEKKS